MTEPAHTVAAAAPGRMDAAETAGFASDVDMNRVPAGRPFRATWTFRNSGQSTWRGDYRLVYAETPHPETAGNARSPLGTATAYTLAELGAPPVGPGETVALTLTFNAPATPGIYATNWQLATPDGRPFGPTRWLRAVVVAVAEAGTLRYDVVGFSNSAGDFNNLQPGQAFSGTWTLRNSGDRAWTGEFRVAYLDRRVDGTNDTVPDPMGAKPIYTLRQVSGRERVAPGETVAIRLELIAPVAPGAYSFHWQLESDTGQPFGGVRWLRVGVVGAPTPPRPRPAPAGPVQFGMNINPDVHDLDVERLSGLRWVRFVFFASRLNLSPEEAYQRRYRPWIQTYAAAGIRSLIILHQDTEWGNAPWDNGGWERYAETFAKACGRVAAACAEFGDYVAYQIFNEQDSGPDNKSAIGIPAEQYAIILDRAQDAIRRHHPGAVVVFGGLNTGPDRAIAYTRAVQARLGGRLPVDALAIHPYGRYVKKAIFNFGSIGKLSDSLDRFHDAFPRLPIWITELGAASDSVIGPEHYGDIADYMREVVDILSDDYAGVVPVLIWFAWTDRMRNSGILTADGRPKEAIFDVFKYMVARGKEIPEALESLAISGRESLDQPAAEFKSFTTTLANHVAVPAGTAFTNRWRFRNSGTTTWDEGFRLVYVPDGDGSDPLTAQTSYDLSAVAAPFPVPPGTEAEVRLDLTAPEQFGRAYRSRWQLRDADDEAFGHLYAEITVVAPPPPPNARPTGMTFLRDQTVPDGTPFVAGTDFHKQWAVRNSGERNWGSGFRLVFAQGDVQMARGVTAHVVPAAQPGEEVILSVPMTAPAPVNGGTAVFGSLWRMQDDRGAFFGDPIWAKITATAGVAAVDGLPSGGTALSRLLNDPATWYSQLDPRWARTTVGYGQQRIESWGCLMTCMAMAMSAYGLRLTPQELNDRLKEHGDSGFIGSNVQFIGPTFVQTGLRQGINLRSFESPELDATTWTGEDPLARIDRNLAAGAIVLAQVDTRPNDGLYNSNIEQHWVVVVKRTPAGDDYLILDPVVPADQVRDQPRSLMLKYGDRKPNLSHEENLRQAIKSTLVYYM